MYRKKGFLSSYPKEKRYFDENDEQKMWCDFSSGRLKSVNILSFGSNVWMDLEMDSDTSDITQYLSINIHDQREGTEFQSLRMEKIDGHINLSTHTLAFMLNGRVIKAFYATNGLIGPSLSSGLKMKETFTLQRITGNN